MIMMPVRVMLVDRLTSEWHGSTNQCLLLWYHNAEYTWHHTATVEAGMDWGSGASREMGNT